MAIQTQGAGTAGYVNGQFRPLSPATGEWDRFLRYRDQLMADTMARLNIRDSLTQSGLAPDTAAAMADVGASEAAVGRFTRPMNQQEQNELIGRAQEYGLSYQEASSMTPAQLRATIASGRAGRLDRRIRQINFEQPGILSTIGRTLTESAAALFVGSAESMVDLVQNTAFIGNTIGKSGVINAADRWLARLDEGVFSELTTEGQQRGWEIATGGEGSEILDPTARIGDDFGIASLVPYLPAGFRAYALAGRLGKLSGMARVGSRMPVLARSAIQGMTAEAMLEWNRPIPIEEKLGYIAAGGIFGMGLEAGGRATAATLGGVIGGVGVGIGDDDPTMIEVLGGAAAGSALGALGLPMIMRRLRQSFRTASDPYGITIERYGAEEADFQTMTGGQPQHPSFSARTGPNEYYWGPVETPTGATSGSQGPIARAGQDVSDLGGGPPPPPPGGGGGGGPLNSNPMEPIRPGFLGRPPKYLTLSQPRARGNTPRDRPGGPNWTGGPATPMPGQVPETDALQVVTGQPALVTIYRANAGPWDFKPTVYASDKTELPLRFSGDLKALGHEYLSTYTVHAKNPFVFDRGPSTLQVARWMIEDNPDALVAREAYDPWADYDGSPPGPWDDYSTPERLTAVDELIDDTTPGLDAKYLEMGATREEAIVAAWLDNWGASKPNKSIGNILHTLQRRGYDVLFSRYGDTYYDMLGSGSSAAMGQEIIPLDPRLEFKLDDFYNAALETMRKGRGLGAAKYDIPIHRPRPDYRAGVQGLSAVRRYVDHTATEEEVLSWAYLNGVDVETATMRLREQGIKVPDGIQGWSYTPQQAFTLGIWDDLMKAGRVRSHMPMDAYDRLNRAIKRGAEQTINEPIPMTERDEALLSLAEADPEMAVISVAGDFYDESLNAMRQEFGAQLHGNFLVVPAQVARQAAVQMEHWHPGLKTGYGANRAEALNGLRGKIGQRYLAEGKLVLYQPTESGTIRAGFVTREQSSVEGVYYPADPGSGGQSILEVEPAILMGEARQKMHRTLTENKRIAGAERGRILRAFVQQLEDAGQPVDLIRIRRNSSYVSTNRYGETAEGVLMPKERLFRRVMNADRAIDDAIAYMKQQEIAKSPVLADKATNPSFTDVDVVDAAIANNPGAVTVLRGIDVDPKILRAMVQERSEKGLMPHNFRYVQHPDGRTDLLIGAGRNIGKKQADDYRMYGMFRGQRAIAGGMEVEITGFDDAGRAMVRGVMDGSDALSHPVPLGQVLPINSTLSRRPADAAEAYAALQSTTREYMGTESAKIGMEEPDWLSQEVSTTLPMMVERTLDNLGIDDPLERAVYTAYFDWKRVQDFKRLAPSAYAWSRQTQAEIIGSLQGVEPRRVPTDELAEQAGWRLVENPDDGSITLFHGEGDLEITVPSLDDVPAVVKNMTNADRSNLTPPTLLPLEAIETVGSAGASNRPARHTRGAPSVIATKLRATPVWEDELEREITELEALHASANGSSGGDLGAGGGGSGGSGGFGGGGGGGFPPGGGSPPPPAGGGGELPGGRRLGLGSGTLSGLVEDRLRRGHDLHNLMVADRRAVNWMTRIFYPMRFQMARAATILNDAGLTFDVNKIYQLYSSIDDGMRKAHNAMLPWIEEANAFLLDVRAEYRRKGVFMKAVEMPEDQRPAYMDRMSFTAGERASVGKYFDFLQRVQVAARREGVNLSSLHSYAAQVRARIDKGLRDQAYAWKDMPEGMRFFGEYARKHNLNFREMDVSELTHHWIRAWKNGVHVAPHADQLQKTWLSSRTLNEALPRTTTMLREWLEIVKFGRPSGDDLLSDLIAGFWQKLGVPVTTGDALRMLGGVQVAMYRAALGYSPAAIARDSLSVGIVGSKIGMAHVGDAIQRWSRGTPEEIKEMLDRGIKYGYIAKGQVNLPQAETFGHQATNQLGLSELPDELLARREVIASQLDSFNDMLPRRYRLGIQGTEADPLLLYTKLNEWSRLIAGDAGWQRASKAWDDYLEHGRADRLMNDSGALLWERPIHHMAETFIRQGDREAFQALMANEAAGMLGRYGTTNTPAVFRSTLGKLATMYGTFSMQFMAYALAGTGGNLARAISGRGLDRAARKAQLAGMAGFSARMGAVMTAVWGVGEALDWDFDKWMWAKAVAYPGGPAATTGLGAIGAVGSVVAESVGERPTIYQEALRSSFTREMEYRGGAGGYIANTFNPYAGGIRTIGGYADALMNEDRPLERAASFTFTGRTGFPKEVEEWFQQYQEQNVNYLPGAGAM